MTTATEAANQEQEESQIEAQSDSESQSQIITDEALEEELKEQGQIGLIEVETQGKKYFKPNQDFTYRLTFDRKAALNVRAQPSTKLTRKIADRNDPKIVGEQPVLEWVHEITHISGNKQLWSITSKKLAAKILNQLINAKSVLDITKRKTGPGAMEVEYDVIGVR